MTRQISKSRSAVVVLCCMELDPAVKKHGFRKSVQSVLPDAPADFLPDAYAVRADDKVIDLIEVIDTNPIMRAKASKIYALADHANEHGWSVVVVGYDSCGGLMFEMPATYFCPAFLRKFMGDDEGSSIPAVMAVAREMAEYRP